MVILAIRHIYLHFIMTYTYIINIEFSHMMNDYMVHMVYTSFVFICMYIYVAEHRRPRSPMRFYVYGGAPPPSFILGFRPVPLPSFDHFWHVVVNLFGSNSLWLY